MLLNKFLPTIEATSPNRVGVVDGGKGQHGGAARGGVGGGGALRVGQAGGEGAHPRRAVRDDGVASQACGARTSATQDGRRRRNTASGAGQIRGAASGCFC